MIIEITKKTTNEDCMGTVSTVTLLMVILLYNWSRDCLGVSWRKHDKSNYQNSKYKDSMETMSRVILLMEILWYN